MDPLDTRAPRRKAARLLRLFQGLLLPPSAHADSLATYIPHLATEVDLDREFPLTVELRPFTNKVGGHTAIFRFSKRAVCKALVNRENVWYETVERRHLKLLPFMPKYIGVLNVRYSSVLTEPALPSMGDLYLSDKEVDLERLLLPDLSHPSDKKVFRPSLPKAHLVVQPKVSLNDNRHIVPHMLWQQYSALAPTTSDFLLETPTGGSTGATLVNTDLQTQVFSEVFDQADEGVFSMDDERTVRRKHTRFERFILLEDLTANMHRPCALDLKMGTRQYGVEASDTKQASQRLKCRNTLSRALGVRVCGLQVWNSKRREYFMRDKYFGRSVKEGAEFAKTLAKFLYDGASAWSIVEKIPAVVAQLQELLVIFSTLNGYRMYGSLVLLMYDGAGESLSIRAHIIDFAQSFIANGDDYKKPPRHPKLPDAGYLRGLRLLVSYFSTVFEVVLGESLDIAQSDWTAFHGTHHTRLQTLCPWVDAFAEGHDPAGPDPFSIPYVMYSEDDVSD